MPTGSIILARPAGADPIKLPSGLTTREVDDGAQLLRALDTSVLAVILDERLAFGDTGDVMAALRQRSTAARLPIILIASRSRAGNLIARARSAAEAVLFEPLDADEIARTLERLVPDIQRVSPDEAGANELAQIWSEHRAEVLDRVALIESASRAALEGRLDGDLRARAMVAAHQLAGSMAVFGFGAAGLLAKRIDQTLRAPSLGRPEIRQLVEASVGLRDALEARPDSGTSRPPGPTLILIEPDPKERAVIEAEARAADLTVDLYDAIPTREVRADGFVVALAADPLLTYVQAIAAQRVPVIVRGFGPESAERAAVGRIKGAAYVAAAAEPAVLVKTWVEAVARTRRLKAARILVVDDDPLIHAAARAALVPLGARLRSITDPNDTWKMLESEPVDLILLDVEMPGMSGIEICRSLRADPRWSKIVIVVFTGLTDPETIGRIWAAGADDYVVKPLGPQLLSRISARLASAPPAPATSSRPSGSLDVVVVEDDAPLARLLLDTMERRGLRVAHLSDGTAAIERLCGKDPPMRASVILLDVGLPGADGYAVLRQLRADEITRTSRVIMLTARASQAEVVQALEGGAFDHVAKPFSVAVLMHRVQRGLEVTA